MPSSVHEATKAAELETGTLKLNAAITIAVDHWFGEGTWFDDEDGQWAFLGLLERILGHLEAAA